MTPAGASVISPSRGGAGPSSGQLRGRGASNPSRSACCTPTPDPSTNTASPRRWRSALPGVHVSASHELLARVPRVRAHVDDGDRRLPVAAARRGTWPALQPRPPRRAPGAGDHAVERRPGVGGGGGPPRGLDGAVRPGRGGGRRRACRSPVRARARPLVRHGRNLVRRRRDRRRRRAPGRRTRRSPDGPLQLPMVDVHTVGAGGGSIGMGRSRRRAARGPAFGGRGAGPALLRARRRRAHRHRCEPAARLPRRRDAACRRRARSTWQRPRARSEGSAGQLGLDVEETAARDRARRRRGDAACAARRDGRARRRPARLCAGGLRRRGADARRCGWPTSLGVRRVLCPPAAACSRRSAWRRPTAGATSGARVLLDEAEIERRGAAPVSPRPRRRGPRRDARRTKSRCRYDLRYRGPGVRADGRRRRTPARPSCASCSSASTRTATGTATPGGGIELVERSRERDRGTCPRRGRRLPRRGGWTAPAHGAVRGGLLETATLRGPAVPGERCAGPAVWELPEATVVVPPGWAGTVDEHGTLSWSGREPRRLDPVTLQVLAGACARCARRWARCSCAPRTRRTSRSAATPRRRCSTARAQMVMQAEHIPVHLGAMPDAVAAVSARSSSPATPGS